MGKKSTAKRLMKKMMQEELKKELSKKKKFSFFNWKKIKKDKPVDLDTSEQDRDEMQKDFKKTKKTKKKVVDNVKKDDNVVETEPLMTNEASEKEIPKTKRKKNLMLAASGAFIIFLLLFVGAFLYKNFSIRPIATLLPDDKTIALAEFDINFLGRNYEKFFNLLKNQEKYSFENIKNTLEKRYSFDYEMDLSPWIGRNMGIAMIESNSDEIPPYFVVLIEYKNLQNLGVFMQKYEKKFETVKGKIQSFDDKKNFVSLYGNFLLLSPSKDALETIIASQSDKNKLYFNDDYRRLEDNLPRNNLAYIYVDYTKIHDNLFRSNEFFTSHGITESAIKPLTKVFNQHAFSISSEKEYLKIQSFLNIDKTQLKDGSFLKFEQQYQKELLKYGEENAMAFWGSHHLNDQLVQIIEIISQGNPDIVAYLNEYLANLTKQYFGPEVNFENDLLPLFNREYAVVLDVKNQKFSPKLLIKLNDSAKDREKLEEIANKLVRYGSAFNKQIVTYKLQDGTEAKELRRIQKELVKMKESYGIYDIYKFKTGEGDFNINYAFFDDLAIIALSADEVKESIDILDEKSKSLINNPEFSTAEMEKMSFADEILYLDIASFRPSIDHDSLLYKLLEPMKTLTLGKIYFDDGLVVINHLRFK